MNASDVERLLRSILPDLPLRLVILFGSVARGSATTKSDVDLGVLPSRELSLTEELALQGRLEEAVGAGVDLVRLDHADAGLRWRVAREGVVLYAPVRTDASRFLARAAIEHDEMAHVMEDAARRFTARLARSSGT
jgi:predicted nucleotidyltransferase